MKTKNKLSKHNSWHKDIHLTSLGWELAVPIFGGAFIGYRIDQALGINYTFTLLLLVVGIIAGYYSLYKYIELEMLRTKFYKQQTHKKEDLP